MQKKEILAIIFLMLILVMELYENRLQLNQWSTIVILFIVMLIILNSHPEIAELRFGLGGISYILNKTEKSLTTNEREEVRAKSIVDEVSSDEKNKQIIFIKLWIDIEEKIKTILSQKDLNAEKQDFSFSHLIWILRSKGGIKDESLLHALSSLRSIKNKVMHANNPDTDLDLAIKVEGIVLAKLDEILATINK